MCVKSTTEITPESTATLPIHFGLKIVDTRVDNIYIGIIIGQGRRRTVSALEESVIFTVSYTQQTIALPERQGWCDSSNRYPSYHAKG